jgi:hypothetical protein
MVIFADEFRDKSKHADPFLGKPRCSGKIGGELFPFLSDASCNDTRIWNGLPLSGACIVMLLKTENL